jgi:Ca2+-binding RTX toxin-like protein
MPTSPRILIAGAALLASLAGASPAAASELVRDGSAFVLRGSPGEANVFGTSRDTTVYNATRVHFYDRTSYPMAVDPALGCETSSTGFGQFANCPIDGMDRVRLEGGDGADIFAIKPTDYPLPGNSVTFDGGAGDDQIDGPTDGMPITILGGEGNDKVTGGQGPDVVDGGPGNDKVDGNDGNDTVLGGPGDDYVKGGRTLSTDVIDGGPGRDTSDGDWTDSSDPLSVTFDGVANDGRPDERDNVLSVEVINTRRVATLIAGDGADAGVEFSIVGTGNGNSKLVGTRFDDKLRTDHYNDVIEAGAGSDAIDAGYGNDTITPGPGQDTVLADGGPNACDVLDCPLPHGNDTIDARDGEKDSIDCGVGTDTVYADAVDVLANCETHGGGGGGGGGGTAALTVRKVPLRKALSRGLRVTVTGVSGRVALTAKQKKRTVARGSATAKSGRAVVVLRFTKKAKRKLRSARTVKLQISGAGVKKTVRLKR